MFSYVLPLLMSATIIFSEKSFGLETFCQPCVDGKMKCGVKSKDGVELDAKYFSCLTQSSRIEKLYCEGSCRVFTTKTIACGFSRVMNHQFHCDVDEDWTGFDAGTGVSSCYSSISGGFPGSPKPIKYL